MGGPVWTLAAPAGIEGSPETRAVGKPCVLRVPRTINVEGTAALESGQSRQLPAANDSGTEAVTEMGMPRSRWQYEHILAVRPAKKPTKVHVFTEHLEKTFALHSHVQSANRPKVRRSQSRCIAAPARGLKSLAGSPRQCAKTLASSWGYSGFAWSNKYLSNCKSSVAVGPCTVPKSLPST
jgi:hypothetical protein